jgi:poly(3-hydroxybutyrate) depolymerase
MARWFTAPMTIVRVAVLAFCVQVVLTDTPVALAQEPAAPAVPPAAARGGRGPVPVDPRVQIREYVFGETNEKLPYAVFVSSRVRPDTKSPLIVALHGLGGTHTSLLRGNALDLAEQGGYILVGPMGYNPRGWYGVPASGRGGRGRPTGAPPANPGAGRQGPPPGALAAANDPPNLRELSEKDVMNVLSLVRQQFNVDERRMYLMGHSMGGAGTFHLAMKYADKWAATASIAPAAFGLQPSSLAAIPSMPMMIVHGDADTAVPIEVGRTWAAAMSGLKMTHQYIEVPGGDHGNVISIGMPDIFKFFAAHSKPAPR